MCVGSTDGTVEMTRGLTTRHQMSRPMVWIRLCGVEVVVLGHATRPPAGTEQHVASTSDAQRVLMGTTRHIPYRHTPTVVLHQLILCRVCDAEVTLRLQTHQVSRP